ncbi:MAG: hypothetical protein EXR59_04645 [Dehalococcoidia bacterium]|nr:hypothetical protein [Dehalococcoidia bacterium]
MTSERPTNVISMADMKAVFNVTDEFGIDREQISVSLEKADPGAVTLADDGVTIEITVPLSVKLDAFEKTLRKLLHDMGHKEIDQDD